MAIPFLITILISMIVLGGTALYFYKRLTKDPTELPPMPSAMASITEQDINEVLFILQPSETDSQPAVMLMHFDPIRKDEHCIGIPLTMLVDHDGREMTVRQCLENHGAIALKNAIGKTLDQPIARYLMMNTAGFAKLTSLIGNVSCVVTIRDNGLRPASTSQELDSSQFQTLLTSKKYSSEQERSAIIGLSVASLLNQCDGKRIAGNLDGYFSATINAVTTDVTAMDFSAHRHAIAYMFEQAAAPAKGITLICIPDGENLRVTEDTVRNLKITFSQNADNPNGSSAAN